MNGSLLLIYRNKVGYPFCQGIRVDEAIIK
jgi:hypothetical protein